MKSKYRLSRLGSDFALAIYFTIFFVSMLITNSLATEVNATANGQNITTSTNMTSQNATIPVVTNTTYYQEYDYYGQPIYYDDNGDYCHNDNNNDCYYTEDDGNNYYKDENGNHYYKDENNNYYYVDTHGHHYWFDSNGNKFYYQDNHHNVQFHYSSTGDKVIHDEPTHINHMQATHYVNNHPGSSYKHLNSEHPFSMDRSSHAEGFSADFKGGLHR